MRASVAEALEALRAQAGVWRAQASEDALKVGFEVARALVGRELEQTAEPLVGVVTDALRELAEARELQVRLHPDDVVAFEAYGVHDKPVGLARVELVGDPQLGRGDVLIDSDVGSIDARLDVRLESIRKALRAAMGGGA